MPTPSTPMNSRIERVYAHTNAADGNAVAVFVRQSEGDLLPLTADPAVPVGPDGTLRPLPTFPTGGLGAGGALISQGALTLSDDGRFLFVVNPGSNEISSFLVTPSGLHLASRVPSGGVLPVSVTSFGNLVYVVNAVSNTLPPVTPGLDGEGKGQIAGFTVGLNGVLTPLRDSIRPLSSTNSAPAQIAFNADGTLLVVTELVASRITVFEVAEDGLPGAMVENDSAGAGPFGFAFNSRGILIVSELGTITANDGSVSSYEVDPDGKLTVISKSVPTNGAATCWIASTPDARYAYASNTASGGITGFRVSPSGELTILDPFDRAGILSLPIDMVIGPDGRYLDVLTQGTQAVMTLRIENDGSLTLRGCVGNLPPVPVGLAVGFAP